MSPSDNWNGAKVNTPSDVEGTTKCAICGTSVKWVESGSVLIGCTACRAGGYWVTRKCATFFGKGPLNEAQKESLRGLIEKGVGSQDRPINHHVIESL
jgi:hypothetical protein